MKQKARSQTLVTPPAEQLVALDDLKRFAKIDHDEEDDLLDSFIGAATTAAENFTRRSFLTQTWRISLDLCGGGLADELGEGVYDLPVTALYGSLPQAVELPRAPVRSIASVTTYGLDNAESAFASENYRLDASGSRMLLNYNRQWPVNLRPQDACRIEYVAGYGDSPADVPKPIREAVKMHAAALYESRGQCGYETPPGCKMMLGQYQIMQGL